MAQRRMFSPDIVSSDAFLDMPASSQALYFHLGMNADDDGFVNPKRIMRVMAASEDDLKVLLAKRFLLTFESGVVVIKHWLIHNLIRADLYKETLYKNEKKVLGLNENGAYTELREGVNEIKRIEAPKWLKIRRGELRTANVPQTARRLGKVRLGKKGNQDANASLPTKSKNMRKNSIGSWSEDNFSDSHETYIDEETNEVVNEKPKAKGKNKVAMELQKKFVDLAYERTGTKPVMTSATYNITLFALKVLSEEHVRVMLEDWFDQRISDEDLISMTRCLSANQINKYKLQHGL